MTELQNKPVIKSFHIQQTKRSLDGFGPIEYVICSDSGPWKCLNSTIKTPYKTESKSYYSDDYNDQIPVVTVEFESGSYMLNSDEKTKISESLEILKNRSLIISGYTDNSGSLELNESLANRRALRVQKYLVSQGLNTENLITEANPLCCYLKENIRSSDMKINRRVEILFSTTH